MASTWYYQIDGQTLGPVSLAQLHNLVQAGKLNRASLVWREGLPDWIPLGSLQSNTSLPSVPTPPPPPPPQSFRPAKRPVVAGSANPWPVVAMVGGLALIAAFSLGWVSRGFFNTPHNQVAAVRQPAARPSPTRQRGTDMAPPVVPMSSPSPLPAPTEPIAAQPTPSATSPEPVSPAVQPVPTPPELAVEPSPKPASSPAPIQPPPAVAASKPAEPQTLYQEIDIQRNPKFSILGVDSVQDVRYQLLSELRIVTRSVSEAARNASEGQTPDRLVGEQSRRTVAQTVLDTRLLKADDLSRPIFEKSLADLKGWQFSYTLNSQGEVIDWTSRPPDGARAAPLDLAGASGVLVTSVMDEDGWKEMAQLSFFTPTGDWEGEAPAEPQPEPLAPGAKRRPSSQPETSARNRTSLLPEGTSPPSAASTKEGPARQAGPTTNSWSRQMTHDFKPLGSWHGETVFTPKLTREGVLQIDYVHRLTYKPPMAGATLGGALPLAIKEAKFAPDAAGGTIYYDVQHGRVVSAQEQFRVRGQLRAELAGQTVPVGVEEQQAIAVKISEQKPQWK